MTDTIELPAALRARTDVALERFAAMPAGAEVIATLGRPALERVFGCSDFIASCCTRDPALALELMTCGDLSSPRKRGPSDFDLTPLDSRLRGNDIKTRVTNALAGVTTESELAARLRRLRRREMVRIAWRDIMGLAELDETLRDLSTLADACIDGALTTLEAQARTVWGTPTDARGAPQRMVVLGMGKLGAGELNFSSDVDLIFAYPEDGETQGGPRQTSNGEFFIRLGQQLIDALNRSTPDGFVFRVDMRLRPFGDAGALALSFDALEQYYQEHGREWERYALIKARACAGDIAAGEQLLTTLRPFVYRRYLDFSAFESLREMKQLITQEAKRRNYERNIKLGSGGIREIEFIGQAFQLIRGGRQKQLQERGIRTVLELLRTAKYLPDFVVDELQRAYVFLRTTEHRLQEIADQQTHMLPTDPAEQARIAYGMNFPDWAAFEVELNRHRARVRSHFEQVFAAPQTETATPAASELANVWIGGLADDVATAILARAGFSAADAALRALGQLKQSAAVRALSPQGATKLAQLIPLLLGAVAQAPRADDTLPRVLALVETIARRTTYLSLLMENPLALSQLVKLCGASPWIAELLRRHPVLLDELLDPRSLYSPPSADALRAELAQRLAAVAPDDLEQQMEALRQFKQANVLRVAAADIADALPLMQVSDHLSWIADAILGATLDLAWRDLAQKHGTPGDSTGFAIVAYGKLGGLELGYGSDLDLVFLYAPVPDDAQTNGAKPLPVPVFYARLAQRIVHILTTHTPSGVLYEVDLRLRPSGASGLLVSSLDAYADYQRTQAWTWEHQALTRTRPIAGDAAVIVRFEQIRREVLSRPRDLDTLRKEVREMREKMRASLGKAAPGQFDLKQGPGGIVDIEFLVQFGVLAWAHDVPALLRWPDNIRQLAELGAAGKLTTDEVATLSEAYRTYRARQHKLTLQGLPAVVADGEYAELRAAVSAAWTKYLP